MKKLKNARKSELGDGDILIDRRETFEKSLTSLFVDAKPS